MDRVWVMWLAMAGALAVVPGSGARVEGGGVRQADPSRAIVKVYASTIGRDVTAPWRPGWNMASTGSGAVISGGRILTAAHVVDDQTFLQVRLNGTARKAQARVLFVSHVADLALLTVDDLAFLRDVVPLELGELPAVRDQVAAYGFPNGGETLSITEGVVARAEHWPYVHSRESLLAIQMDAAIAPGSSGGPLLRDGRIAGVAMQGFKESAIGSAVPAPLLRQFLLDVEDGRLDGIPALGIGWQSLENDALRSSLRVPERETGVLLTSVDAAPAGKVLQEGDVLLGLGNRAVADDGTVELRSGERTELDQVADVRQVGATVAVRYLRDGVVHSSSISLTRARGEGRLVPRLFDRNADYYIFGGLGFVTLTQNFLDVVKEHASPALLALRGREADGPRDGVVLVANVLANDVNAGYEDAVLETVHAVDGRAVASLAELVALVERRDAGRFVTFELGNGTRVTLDRERAVATGPAVLARYEVASDRSPWLRTLGPVGPVARAAGTGVGGGR